MTEGKTHEGEWKVGQENILLQLYKINVSLFIILRKYLQHS